MAPEDGTRTGAHLMNLLYPLAVSIVVTAVVLSPSAIALWWEARQQRDLARGETESL